NQQKWIGLAVELPKRDLEREVARVNPRATRPEQARFLDAYTLELCTPLSEVGYKKLQRARELMASSLGEWVSLESAIENLAEFYLQRKDPVRRAERAERRHRKAESISDFGLNVPVPTETTEEGLTQDRNKAATATHDESLGGAMPSDEKLARAENLESTQSLTYLSHTAEQTLQDTTESSLQSPPQPAYGLELRSTPQSKRRPLPAAIQHQVHLRDRGACQARLPDGSVCGSRVWLEFHHLTLRSRGGSDSVDNLLTLCRAHHLAWHENG
ncbi:MAG: HNH endonuclease, partial [Bdellovibrionaceae bacterium]|nr:HNH endonuclease [Pseudobdellovibrionaceae bacterium]